MPVEVEEDRRSVLAAIGPLDQDLELSERDHDAAQAVAAGLRDAKAPNTHRAYESAWQAFQAWADAGGHRYCPQLPRPSPSTWAAWRRMARPWPPSSRPALPSPMPMPRRGWRRPTIPPAIRSSPKRSRAGGIRFQRLGRPRRLPPMPRPASVKLPACSGAPAGAHGICGSRPGPGHRRRWPSPRPRPAPSMQQHNAEPSQPVFGMTGETLANRIRAAARAAGLGEGFSGHSGRIGMARRIVAAGAPNAVVQNQGRWKQGGGMVGRYTRGESAGSALRY